MLSKTDQSLALARSLPFLCWPFKNLSYFSSKYTRLSLKQKAFFCVNTLPFILLNLASLFYDCLLLLDFSKTMHLRGMIALDLQKHWSRRSLWRKKYLWVHQINRLCHQVNQEKYRLIYCDVWYLYQLKMWLKRVNFQDLRLILYVLVH